MRKTILLAYIALLFTFLLPIMRREKLAVPTETAVPEVCTPPSITEQLEAEDKTEETPAAPAADVIMVLTAEGTAEMDIQEYLVGVVAAEMPASFQPEALRAQAVAARTYALYSADGNKHGEAQVCTDFACCQAWLSEEDMRTTWGSDYESYAEKIRAAVADTKGQYLSYEGIPVFAAFHSSSSGATEDCGQVWNERPYLVSVKIPETAENVPNYISTLDCAPIDFRDALLSAFPQADFTGDESDWIGEIRRDESGRVSAAVLGGVEMKGTKLRSLFSLRSTAFTLEYLDGRFFFTVTGNGHGVGMSQYGAQVMAENGSDYTQILAHYYPGTLLSV